MTVFSSRSKSLANGHSIVVVNGAAGRDKVAPRNAEARSRRRLTVLRDRDFARFFAGYATSLLGTSMSSLAVSFAVLDNGGTAGDLGVVLAAGIVPRVLFMLGGGVIADRLGRAWLVVTTLQSTLFNLLTWGPFLLLGPVLCRDYLGGAGAWGAVMACYGAGSVLGALLALGRRPCHPRSPRPWPRSATACPARCSRCAGRWPRSPPGPWWPAWDLP